MKKVDTTIIARRENAWKKGKHRLPSLRKSLLFLFVVSWIIPVAVLSFFIFNQYQNAYIDRTESDVMNAVNVSGVLLKTQIDSAVSKVNKQATGGEWERQYRNQQADSKEHQKFLIWMRSQLVNKYYMDSQFSCVAFYQDGEKEPQTYTGKNGYEYETFLANIDPKIQKIRAANEKLTSIAVIDGQIYLIQNLYLSTYDRIYGTLVVGMLGDELFKDVPLLEPENVFVDIDDSGNYLTVGSSEVLGKKKDALSELTSGIDTASRRLGVISTLQTGYAGYSYQADSQSYHLSLYYLKDMRDMYFEISRLNLIVVITVIGMIPLMIYSYLSMKENAEYTQRMATKDAQIAALQAQINPHFLNNTLEMMNWQARMNGDAEISKMIEALGTVLDSGINRDNDKLVRLSEELRCGDAFLYIMSMRFGQRLCVEKLVDRNLMQVMVPQLILQPILENAIKHGVESVNFGTIWLNIFEEDNKLIIDVINSGKKLTDSDIDRIRSIISGQLKLDHGTPGVHTSIGIYNVNKRLELIFGEEYGLSVHRIDDDKLQFRMTMPLTAADQVLM